MLVTAPRPDIASFAPARLAGAELAVIVPTFREAGNIGPLIARLSKVLIAIDAEVIVVDDWSDEGTAERVEALAARDPRVRLIRRFGRRGLASAVVEGMLSTTAPVVAVIDADLQHDERVLPALFAAIKAGADARSARATRTAARPEPGAPRAGWSAGPRRALPA